MQQLLIVVSSGFQKTLFQSLRRQVIEALCLNYGGLPFVGTNGSFRQISTRWLALFAGRLKTSRSQGTAVILVVTFISNMLYM